MSGVLRAHYPYKKTAQCVPINQKNHLTLVPIGLHPCVPRGGKQTRYQNIEKKFKKICFVKMTAIRPNFNILSPRFLQTPYFDISTY